MFATKEKFDLDDPLLDVRTDSGEVGHWTIGHAVEGVQIFGGIGSGKTSGSGRTLALKFLKAGFGGLVLTAKPDEKDLWESYCKLAGRSNDLIILEPGRSKRFNFLHYEASQADGQQALTTNLLQVLKTAIRAGEDKAGGGQQDNSFWESALDMLIVNLIDLCQLAYGSVTVKDMYDIAQSIPQKEEDTGSTPIDEKKRQQQEEKARNSAFGRAYLAAKNKVDAQVLAWRDNLKKTLSLEAYEALVVDNANFLEHLKGAVPDVRALYFLQDFFLETMNKLGERTRSIINLMLTGFLFQLLREPVYSLLCSGVSNVTPEASLRGKIILLNLPVKVYQKVGQDCQVLFKYIWQRAMERRDVRQNQRPVFLWADEAQNFLHEHDAVYQATARSSRIATVYISQNLPNYYASMGGEKSQYRVKSFLGTLNTKIFHANADIETNRYASELIGQEYAEKISESIQLGPTFSSSISRAQELKSQVRPEQFARLKTGGLKNARLVEGYMAWQGNTFIPNLNHLKLCFHQEKGLS